MLQANPHLVMMIELYEPSAQQCGCIVKNTLAMLKNLEFFPHRLDDQGNILPLSSGAQQELIQGANKDYNFIFKRLGI